ncbi:MAG: MucR family transcriptional regulator [Magnetococcus sp. MYC-9]
MSLIEHTAAIVQAYLSKNELPVQQIGELIGVVHRALSALPRDPWLVSPEAVLPDPLDPLPVVSEALQPVPFVPVEQAITADSITCLICGKTGKAIRGHLTRTHGIDIPTYLARYGLPKDFPMVAASYSETRRQLAIAARAGETLRAGRKKRDGEH